MKRRKAACPSCGAPVEFTVGSVVSVCEFCQSAVARTDRPSPATVSTPPVTFIRSSSASPLAPLGKATATADSGGICNPRRSVGDAGLMRRDATSGAISHVGTTAPLGNVVVLITRGSESAQSKVAPPTAAARL